MDGWERGGGAGVGGLGEVDVVPEDSAADGDNSESPENTANDESKRDDRLASSEKPQLGQTTMLGIMARAAARVIQAYRSENGLLDLFGHSDGAVAVTTIDDKDIFGSNSGSSMYTREDFTAATNMRDNLLSKYPDVMATDNVGQAPNNALFHAETNVLLRAADTNGGALNGRSLDVYADRELCRNCQTVLPLVGLELGNPILTFVDPKTITTIYSGSIVSRSRR